MTNIVKAVLFGALLAASATSLRAFAAEEDPVKSLELKLDGACDSANKHLWLVNNHASKAIVATLRWNLAGSKRIVTDKFQVAPVARVEIGCAAQADIVAATFVQPG